MSDSALKELARAAARRFGYEIRALPRPSAPGEIPDADYYDPLFSPWLGLGDFGEVVERVRPRTLVSRDRLYMIWSLARQALTIPGEFWECGVYRGGTARLLAELAAGDPGPAPRRLRLFDSFAGMRETDPELDLHQAGDFADTDLASVRAFVGHESNVSFHEGWIPETFRGFEQSNIALAHIDVDLYQSVVDCCEFIVPRMSPGGFIIFDDYGFPSCPGARRAVDEFFRSRREVPLVLPTGQAIAFVVG